MKELTIEYVIENKFSFSDCVKYFKPDVTPEEIEFILWEKTCFPFSTEQMVKQLNDHFKITKQLDQIIRASVKKCIRQVSFF